MTNAAVHIEGQQPSLHAHLHDALASGATHTKGQQHPIKLYLVVWGWLFVLIVLAAVFTAVGILVHGVAASVENRRSRRQLPPRPGPRRPAA